MSSAITVGMVADYIIFFAREVGEAITNLKLQKLLYYCQAWHLAIVGKPLFDGRFEAWVHGPVISHIYSRFKEHRWQPIHEEIELPVFPKEIKDIIDEVLDAYMGFTPYQLELMTHRELPWREARGDLPADAASSNAISEETMMQYYRQRLDGEEE